MQVRHSPSDEETKVPERNAGFGTYGAHGTTGPGAVVRRLDALADRTAVPVDSIKRAA